MRDLTPKPTTPHCDHSDFNFFLPGVPSVLAIVWLMNKWIQSLVVVFTNVAIHWIWQKRYTPQYLSNSVAKQKQKNMCCRQFSCFCWHKWQIRQNAKEMSCYYPKAELTDVVSHLTDDTKPAWCEKTAPKWLKRPPLPVHLRLIKWVSAVWKLPQVWWNTAE